jgi:formylglycine-generating enzyme required for sulfatase activity
MKLRVVYKKAGGNWWACGRTVLYRGGSWFSYPGGCRSATKDSYYPDEVSFNLGLRLCRPVEVECELKGNIQEK